MPVSPAGRESKTCLQYQRRNIEAYHKRGVFFNYETMCKEPVRVAQMIGELVAEIDDLELRQRLPVKGRYHETLTDMNARQISRLKPEQLAACNRVFEAHREVLDYFGYELLVGHPRGPAFQG